MMSSSDELLSAWEMRTLLTCPICRKMLNDPCLISSCQHCFCFRCINEGIEKGVTPCRLPWDVPCDGDEVSSQEEVEDEPAARRGKGKKKPSKKNKMTKFECPVCGLAAYKWMLQRIPILSNFVHRLESVLSSLPPQPFPPTESREDDNPVHNAEANDNGEEEEGHDEPPQAGGNNKPSASHLPSSNNSSVVLLDESYPLWQAMSGDTSSLHAAAAEYPVTAASDGHAQGTSSSLVGFLRTPLPTSSTDGSMVVAPREEDALINESRHSLAPSSILAASSATVLGAVTASSTPPSRSLSSPPLSALCPQAGAATPSSCSTSLNRSATRPRNDDSPILNIVPVVRILIDESLTHIKDAVTRDRYLELIRIAVNRLGGAIVNPECCHMPLPTMGTPMSATHCVCALNEELLAMEPTAGLCEAVFRHETVQTVGLSWVVKSLERGSWILDTLLTQPFLCQGYVHDVALWTAASVDHRAEGNRSGLPLSGLGVVLVDGGDHGAITSALRLCRVLGARAVWVASASASSWQVSSTREGINTLSDAATSLFGDDGNDSTAEVVLVLSTGTSHDVCNAVPLSLSKNALRKLLQPSSARDFFVVRRPLRWLFVSLIKGLGSWTTLKAALQSGRIAETDAVGQDNKHLKALYSNHQMATS